MSDNDHDVNIIETATNAEALRVLEFWFGSSAAGEETLPERKIWWRPDAEFDAACRKGFADLSDRALAGEFDHWAETASGALALVLLLDQLPRNIHRGRPEAYAGDDKARTVAGGAIARGFDAVLAPVQRLFLYLPLEHSETLADQERVVRLIAVLGNDTWLDFARRHRDIIARFGRFPHRNAALGRATTAEETVFLQEPGSSF